MIHADGASVVCVGKMYLENTQGIVVASRPNATKMPTILTLLNEIRTTKACF